MTVHIHKLKGYSSKFVPVAQPETMIGFLRGRGGLKDCDEMRVRDARLVWPKLINNKRGLSLDYAREACEEARFLPTFSSVSDFLDALDAHPFYRPHDIGRLIAWQAQKNASRECAYPEESEGDYGDEFDALASGTRALQSERTALKGRMVKVEQDAAAEASRALAWRKAHGLSRAELAALTGFSASQIQDYEEGARRGKRGAAAEISEAAWLRYRLACAAALAKIEPAW